MKEIHMLTFPLVLVGALNWGLMGLFGFNLVTTLFGFEPMFVRLIYIIVGLAAVIELTIHSKTCACCCNVKPKK